MSVSPFRVHVADLLRRPGATRDFGVAAPIEGLDNGGAAVVGDVDVEGRLERISEGLVVRGTVSAAWEARCSRCLRDVRGALSVHVDELFEREPLAGETYQLDVDTVDVEPLARDALLLDLPTAPLCRDECAGLCAHCGVDRNETDCDCHIDELDPRWAALRSLDIQN
ncbi:MAG: YceD family protein [Actinomycetota bacterium]